MLIYLWANAPNDNYDWFFIMAVLKSQDAIRASKGAIVLDMGDLKRQADILKENARAEAKEMIAVAKQQLEAMSSKAHDDGFEVGKKDGYEAGFAQGLEAGKAQVYAELSGDMQGIEKSWVEAAKSWETYREAIDHQMRASVLEMSLLIAKRVVHRVVEVDETVIIDQLGNALSHVLRPLDVVVKINPADQEIVEHAMPELNTEFKHLKSIALEMDSTVGRGGCEVHFGYGVIDARVNRQLDRLIDAFLPKGGASEVREVEGVGADGSEVLGAGGAGLVDGVEGLNDVGGDS